MELAINTAVVERSETFAEKAFSIGNPVVIMKIMRSKLYSNPIKVLIQEYLCNARDANREAGSDKPIEIFLPTKLNQSFEVRDYGIGISPTRMENVFIKYGESTKRGDNKQTGGFGIGAKSGWSYSDSFSVTTITQEGERRVKRFYSAIIDETEQGSLVKIGDDQIVDEPTGTRIIVPIKEKDISLFSFYSKQTVCFWNEEVSLLGDGLFNPKYDYSYAKYRGTDWVLHPKHNCSLIHGEYSNHNRCLAIVDGIQYSIKDDAISDCPDAIANTLLRDIFNNRFLLFFKTGELNISANREELYYDDKTKNAIISKLKVVENEFMGIVNKVLNATETYIDLVEAWSSFETNHLTLNHTSRQNFLADFEWKGVKTKIITAIRTDVLYPMDIREYTYSPYRGRRQSSYVSVLNMSKKITVYENDEGTHLAARGKIQTLINKHGKNGFYVIGYGDAVTAENNWKRERKIDQNDRDDDEDDDDGYDSDSDSDTEYYTPETFAEDVAEVRAKFNFDLFNFVKLSTIEKFKAPKKERTTPRVHYSRTKKVMFDRYQTVEPYEMEIHEQTGYYLKSLNKNTVIFDGRHYDSTSEVIKGMYQYFSGIELFYIPEKTIGKAIKKKKGVKLIPFETLVREELSKNPDVIRNYLINTAIKDSDVIKEITVPLNGYRLSNHIDKIQDENILTLIKRVKEVSEFNMHKICKLLTHVSDINQKAVESHKEEIKETLATLMTVNKEVTTSYPLLKLPPVATYASAIVDYLNAIYEVKNKACAFAAV